MADPDPKGTAGSPFPGWLGSGELVREADIISLGAGPLDAGPDYGAAGPGPAEGMAAMAQQTALGFAGLLRQLRTEARLTQEELAQAAGLSPRSVSDLERGVNRTARKDTAVLLAGALGVPEPVRDVFVAAARGRAPAVEVLAAVLRAWHLEDEEMLHAVRVIRSSLHGFVSLEAGGGFALPLDLDKSFQRLIETLAAGLPAIAGA